MSPPRWSGRVRGRPPPKRPTRMRSMTGMNCGASPHWPGVISRARGRHPPSPARWILQVRPPPGAAEPLVGTVLPGRAPLPDLRGSLACSGRVLVGSPPLSPLSRSPDPLSAAAMPKSSCHVRFWWLVVGTQEPFDAGRSPGAVHGAGVLGQARADALTSSAPNAPARSATALPWPSTSAGALRPHKADRWRSSDVRDGI